MSHITSVMVVTFFDVYGTDWTDEVILPMQLKTASKARSGHRDLISTRQEFKGKCAMLGHRIVPWIISLTQWPIAHFSRSVLISRCTVFPAACRTLFHLLTPHSPLYKLLHSLCSREVTDAYFSPNLVLTSCWSLSHLHRSLDQRLFFYQISTPILSTDSCWLYWTNVWYLLIKKAELVQWLLASTLHVKHELNFRSDMHVCQVNLSGQYLLFLGHCPSSNSYFEVCSSLYAGDIYSLFYWGTSDERWLSQTKFTQGNIMT